MLEANNPVKTLTLWAYPVGNWAQRDRVQPLLDAFRAETGIEVRMEALNYDTGDKKVQEAINRGTTPDLVLEGPERLVADWGAAGVMEDLRDIIDETDRKEIHRSVLSACTAPDGSVYVYPLCRTVHCMAINVDAFRAANALRYVNLRKHTWTTEQFFQSVAALSAKYGDAVGAVYCGGQGGDQGTRALVTNLFGGAFTDEDHTKYVWDDPRNIRALETLRNTKGLYYDPYLVGGDEIDMFRKGKLKMAFCWNVSWQLSTEEETVKAGRTLTGEEIAFMAFPSPNGVSKLQPGTWGFGVFKGDPDRVAAAKAFVRFICNSEHTGDAVRLAGHFAARMTTAGRAMPRIWQDNEIMREYNTILPYIGDNNQIVKGWRKARTAWWTMLQKIGEGGDIRMLVSRYMREANQAAQ